MPVPMPMPVPVSCAYVLCLCPVPVRFACLAHPPARYDSASHFAEDAAPPLEYGPTSIRGLAGGFRDLQLADAEGGALKPGQCRVWPVWVMAGNQNGAHALRLLIQYSQVAPTGVAGGGACASSPSARELSRRSIRWASEVGVVCTAACVQAVVTART